MVWKGRNVEMTVADDTKLLRVIEFDCRILQKDTVILRDRRIKSSKYNLVLILLCMINAKLHLRMRSLYS